MGLLRIRGTIDLEQFWPEGEADADTSKVKVTVGEGSFQYAADGQNFANTGVYFGAVARGTGSKEVIDKKNRITVRLQGVDAPELHYKAAPLRKNPPVSDAKRKKFNAENKNRRQYWAETATVALADKLLDYPHPVDCYVVSLVETPGDAIDTYGRFVGNIFVGANFRTDINLWLSEQGWAYPTFYWSMTKDEIKAYLKAIPDAQQKGRIWKAYSTDISKFDAKLLFRPHGPKNPAKDKGKVLMPKIFRRQVAYRVQKKVGIVSGDFKTYLDKKIDYCFLTSEFLDQGTAAPMRRLSEFVKGKQFKLKPHEVVFKEDPSVLVDKNNKKIEKF